MACSLKLSSSKLDCSLVSFNFLFPLIMLLLLLLLFLQSSISSSSSLVLEDERSALGARSFRHNAAERSKHGDWGLSFCLSPFGRLCPPTQSPRPSVVLHPSSSAMAIKKGRDTDGEIITFYIYIYNYGWGLGKVAGFGEKKQRFHTVFINGDGNGYSWDLN